MIVKMQHLDLLCLASDKGRTLERLRDLGAVHLDLASARGPLVASAKGVAEDAEKAVRAILRARGKGERPAGLRQADVAEVLDLAGKADSLKERIAEERRQVAFYEPYGDFDPDLARKLLAEGIDLSSVAELPDPLPPKRLSSMKASLSEMEKSLSAVVEALAGCDDKSIVSSYPGLADAIAFAAAEELMAQSGEIAYVSGWIPAPAVRSLKDAAAAGGWGVLVRDPEEGESPPTLIEPPRLFRPVTALFSGLGIAPAYTESDVSVPFLCYFALFFAMLVGDGGYGAIILAMTLFGWKKTSGNRSLVAKSWLTLLTVFSLATIAWGVLSNTWFGAALPFCREWPTVRWLAGSDAAPGHEYDNMMLLCFTIGASHLILARLWSAFSMLNDRRCLAQFGWTGIVFFMYIVTNTIIGIFPGIPTWSYWMFGVSFATVFVQAKGIDKGMLFLNTMSVLGDVISYVRLFAVGLASVKVASNFNDMALSIFNLSDSLWLKPLTALGMVAVLLVGHGLNFAMAGLSILVHAVRLNTLEFSNHKGITWSGYAFKPFKKN